MYGDQVGTGYSKTMQELVRKAAKEKKPRSHLETQLVGCTLSALKTADSFCCQGVQLYFAAVRQSDFLCLQLSGYTCFDAC